jgi:two-component system cell cycle sensor histidine kinase/response regulator CckA
MRTAERAGTGERPRTRVLLIDDDDLFLRAVHRVLARDHDVRTAENGVLGLQMIVEAEPPFDVVLCDVSMPDMSGDALHAQLGEVRPDLRERLIFVSGGATCDAEASFLRGVPHLLKPIDVSDLRVAIDHVVAGRG